MSDSTTRTTRRRKAQAIAAGGIVLGIGAAVTLAAWNDSEFAQGTFGSASFNLEGSVDGTTYVENPEGDPAVIFDSAALNLVPNQTVYDDFWVRLDSATSVDGSIEAGAGLGVAAITEVANADDETNSENLSYAIYNVSADGECSAAGVEDLTAVASGGSLAEGEIGPSAAIDLESNGPGTAGDAVQLCFQITAADGDEFNQDVETTVTWRVTATSDDS